MGHGKADALRARALVSTAREPSDDTGDDDEIGIGTFAVDIKNPGSDPIEFNNAEFTGDNAESDESGNPKAETGAHDSAQGATGGGNGGIADDLHCWKLQDVLNFLKTTPKQAWDKTVAGKKENGGILTIQTNGQLEVSDEQEGTSDGMPDTLGVLRDRRKQFSTSALCRNAQLGRELQLQLSGSGRQTRIKEPQDVRTATVPSEPGAVETVSILVTGSGSDRQGGLLEPVAVETVSILVSKGINVNYRSFQRTASGQNNNRGFSRNLS